MESPNRPMRPPVGHLGDLARKALLLMLVAGAIISCLTFLRFVEQGFVAWDAPTYLAAGERLNAGHPLYALSAGDRPVLLNPPFWTVPLLSPPPIAVLWRPLALIGSAGMLIWWLTCLTTIGATTAAMAIRSPWVAGPALLVLSIPLGWELAAANLNGLLFGGFVAAWLLARAGRDREAGILIGVMAAMKVWPIILIMWAMAQGRREAVLTCALSIVVIAAASVVFAGVGAHLDYLRIGASIYPSPDSIAGLLRSVGLNLPWIGYALGLATSLLMVRFRRQPEATYSLAVVTIVVASPVIYLNGLALLFTALAPFLWPLAGRPHGLHRMGLLRGRSAGGDAQGQGSASHDRRSRDGIS